MKSRGISGEALGKEVKKGKSAISTWVNDIVSPSINDLILIRNFFNVDLDLLITGSLENLESEKNPQNVNFVSEIETGYGDSKHKEVTIYIEKECVLTGGVCAFNVLSELRTENERLKAENEILRKKK